MANNPKTMSETTELQKLLDILENLDRLVARMRKILESHPTPPARQYTIKSPRQENGLWGTPFTCFAIDKVVPLPDELWKLQSAIIVAISEVYPDESFDVSFSDDKGFLVTLEHSGIRTIRYEDYKLDGNTLTFFGRGLEPLVPPASEPSEPVADAEALL